MNNLYIFVLACLCLTLSDIGAQSISTDRSQGKHISLNSVWLNEPIVAAEEEASRSEMLNIGNTASGAIALMDMTPPVFTVLPSDTIVECDACNSFTVFNNWLDNHGGAEAIDSMSEVTWDYYVASSTSDCVNIRRDSVGFIASDSSGNADTAFAIFIVVDTEPPLFNVAVQKLTADTLISSTAMWQPNIAQFDTTLGTLLEVEIKAVNRYRRRVAIENTEAASVVMTDTLNAYLLYAIDPPGLTYEAAIGSAINADTNLYNNVSSYGAFDGTIDFAGPSGSDTGLDTIPFFADCDGLAGINGGDLAPFIGTGMVDLWFIGKAKALATGSGNFVAQFISQYMLDVDVTYTYLVADAPEDTTIVCRSALPDPVIIPAYDLCQDITYQITSTDSLVVADSLCPNTVRIIRSWTAVDACGNDSVLTQTINIIDTIPPVLIGPLPGDTVINCIEFLPPISALQAVDNCLDTLVALPGDSVVQADSLCLNQQIILRVWRFDDSCGNNVNHVQTITVLDTIPPTITSSLPMDVTVTCVDNIPAPDTLRASDQCQGEIVKVPVDTIVDVFCPNRFSIKRTWTFEDTCLNQTTFTQTITVFDTVTPVVVCPMDVVLQCPADTSVLSNGMASATDNCGGAVSITYRDSVIVGSCSSEMTIYRIWVAEDSCLLQSECVQVIQVIDDEPPVIDCPTDLTLHCPADTSIGATGMATAFDSCGAVTITYVDVLSPGACAQEYTIARTWTATDVCGNDSSCTQSITIIDERPPNLTCPADLTLQCVADTSVGVTGMPMVFDSCGMVTVTYMDSIEQGNCAGEFVVYRTWNAQDACMNDSSCVQIITVIDTIPPSILCPLADTLECPTDTMVMTTDHIITVDECSQVTLTYQDSVVVGACPQEFTLYRKWTATDQCQNAAMCTEVFVVTDETPPTISCPADVTLACPADTSIANTGVLVAADMCGDTTISYVDSLILGNCPNEFTIIRIWIAGDACMNRDTCYQSISVIDDQPPSLTCPADLTLACPADTSVQLTGVALAEDICGDVVVTYRDSIVMGSCPQEFEIVRIWNAVDACMNDTSCIQLISIVDNTPPTLICPVDLTIDCPADTSVQSTGMAMASDVCGAVTLLYADSIIGGACPAEYIIERTWRAFDMCMNDTVCTQMITLIDTVPPVIQCPADVTLQCPTDTSTAMTGMANASDACSGVDMLYADSVVVENCPNNFAVFRRWMVTDSCGNAASCLQVIRVVDTIPPSIVCPSDLTLNCPADTSISATGMPTVSDSCGAVMVTYDDQIIEGDCPANYSIVRTWTARDLCDNQMSCMQTIVVQDTTPPSLMCPDDISVNCITDTSVLTTGVAIGFDSCQSVMITYSDEVNAGNCPIQFEIIRTWSVEDSCGNNNLCQQLITVVDTVLPTIECPNDTTLYCPVDIGEINLEATGVTGCGDTAMISFVDEIIDGACDQSYIIERYWIAQNGCGYADTCMQLITVLDTTAPILILPEDITLDCGADTSAMTLGTATAIDSCQLDVAINYSDIINPGNCEGNFEINRIWMAQDSCGNVAVDTQRISVIDTIAPIINCLDDLFSDCDTSIFDPITSIVEFLALGGSIEESCCLDSLSFNFVDSTVNGENGMITYRTFSISDCCGNASSCLQTITLNDTIPPIANCQDTLCYEIGSGSGIIVLNVDSINNGSSDNCFIDSMYLSVDTLTCEDEGDYQYEAVTLYVVDAFGNIDSCSTIVKITCAVEYDLALKNTVDDEVYRPRDTIPMTVTIYNQSSSSIIVDSVEVIHYIPEGLCLADNRWTAGSVGVSGQSATRILASNNGLPVGGLIAGDSVSMEIKLYAKADIPRCVYVDYAEIIRAVDRDGNVINGLDIDSPYDMDDTNDAGGLPGSAADNEIFGDGTGTPGDGDPLTDEDDHDPAQICIMPEIALFGPENPCPEEVVTYYFTGYEDCQNYTWNLSGGGVMQTSTDSSVSIRWFNLPGQIFEIRLTADNGIAGCIDYAYLNVTIQDDLPLACNDNLNISLGEDCEFVFTADIGLEDPPYNDESYVIELLDQYGNVIPENTLTHEHIGQQITFIVRSRCYERSCWGYVNVEDKIKPNFDCRRDTVGCDADYSVAVLGLPDSAVLLNQVDGYTFIVDGLDNCDEVILTYADEEVEFDCVTSQFNKLVVRTWTAVDSSGNSYSCADSIYFEKLSLDSIGLPLNHDGIDLPVLDCSETWDLGCDLLPNTLDAGEGDGIPQPCEIDDVIAARCNIHVSYVDEVIATCVGSKKIIRKYYVTDHCTGQFINHDQIIIIEDKEPPVVTCPADVTISTVANGCAGILALSAPDAVDACGVVGDWSIDISAGQIIDFGNGNISVNNLPIGEHVITYYVEDACGNVGSCSSKVIVVDNIPPVAICDVNTQISLDQHGTATLHAATINDGSYDNCGVERVEIRRLQLNNCWDTEFRESIDFCCEDIAQSPVEVILRVTDSSGLSNECHAMVVVEDKLPPVMVCPPDISVSCGFAFDLNNLAATFGRIANINEGESRSDILIDDAKYQQNCENVIYNGPSHWGVDGYAEDNCNVTISETSNANLTCGAGVITRVFTAIDASGNSTSCIQRIHVVDCSPYYIIDTDNPCRDRQAIYSPMDGVEWPCDQTLIGCGVEDTSPTFTGRPEIIVGDASCSMLADTFYDEVFAVVDDACFKILRHWSIIDWCQMANGLPKRWDYTQIIKVIDDEAPVIGPGELRCDSTAASCNGYISIAPDVQDCTPADMMTYWWRVDLDDDGLGPILGGFDMEGFTREAGAEFPIGSHRILWVIEDMCGNRSTTEYYFTIDDCKKPSPVCLTLNSVIMPSSGLISIEAATFDASSFDNCDDELEFRVYSAIMDSMYYADQTIDWQLPSVNTTGADVLAYLPDNIVVNCEALMHTDSFEVEVYVVDDAGNWDYCTTWISIDDNDEICHDSLLSIAGHFYTESGEPMTQVMVELAALGSADAEQERAVAANGAYQFIATQGSDYFVTGYLDDEYLNGVTANDLSLVQRHVAGIEYFTSPYQHVAADINMDRSLDIRDVLELRRILLGIYETPQSGTGEPWCMVDAAYDFEGLSHIVLPADVYDRNRREYAPLLLSDYSADFVGVKMGDVDGDVQLLASAEERTSSYRTINFEISHTEATTSIHFYATEDMTVSAMQLVLDLDVPAMAKLTMVGGRLSANRLYVNERALHRHYLPIVYSNETPVQVNAGEKLFSIDLSDYVADVTVGLRDRGAKHLIFDEKGQQNAMRLHANAAAVGGFELLQNQPNPMADETVIGFIMPVAQEVQLAFYGMDGQLLRSMTIDAQVGLNEVSVSRAELEVGADHVLLYRLTSADYSATKKLMLHID